MKIERSSDAWVEKLHSVHFFKEFYAKNGCLIEAAVLDSDDVSNKKYALVRVFIDLAKKKQPYVIFIDDKKGVIFIDLISAPVSLEEIIMKNEKCSLKQLVFGAGMLNTENGINFLDQGKVDDLAATLLWAVSAETNLSPKIGLEEVKTFLNPTC